MNYLKMSIYWIEYSINNRKDQEFIAPGVLKGDGAKRSTKEEMYCNCVKFSPTGDSWAVASSQGLIIYSLDPTLSFDPFDLKEEVTPISIKYALAGEELIAACMNGSIYVWEPKDGDLLIYSLLYSCC